MKKRFDPPDSGPDSGYGIGDLLGLGSQSVRKNYYPALQARIDELEQLNASLERRVEERTEALQNANLGLRREIDQRQRIERELVRAIEVAKDANRGKDKYLAAASHDLLQPLNAARLMISALQDSELPAQETRMVHQVHQALEGAEDLLADLLDISKLDQQAMKPDWVYTDVAALARTLGEEFQAVAASEGLGFRLRVRPALVRTDQRMLARILRNLLSNAFRYTRRGGVVLALRSRGDRLRIEVWDTGVGIEADKLREIFTEFHQLLPRGTGGRQGVGLGLAIVERMARMLGYDIDVSSRPGRGSRFVLTLPLERVSMPPALPRADMLQRFTDGFDDLLVLLIDNEPAVLESMTLLLQRWGCSVLAAASKTQAVELLTKDGRIPALILADYHLNNERTGYDAVHGVRRYLGLDIPAAIITADRSDTTRRLLRAQYLPILNKPVKPNRLRALMTSLLPPPAS